MKFKKCHQETGDEAEAEEDTLSLCDLPIYSREESQSSSSVSSSETEYFEFYSEEWSNPASSINLPPEKIIFCGKVIPRKEDKGRKNSRNDSESKALALRETETSSSLLGRSRLFLFLFGMAGRPKQMDLKEMKNRQSRRASPSSPPPLAVAAKVAEGRRSRLWWMIRALSCGGGGGGQVHAQAIVKVIAHI